MRISRKEVLSVVKEIDKNRLNNFGVYCIRNLSNDKIYIGSTCREEYYSVKGFSIRFREHLKDLCNGKHCCKKLQRAFNKSKDINIWQFEILEICDKSIVREREQYYLNKLLHAYEYVLDKKDRRFVLNGYNSTPLVKYGNHVRNCKRVYQYDLEGNFIKEWTSIKEISEKFKVAETNISRACRKDGSCKGYLWKYKKYKNVTKKLDRRFGEKPASIYMYTLSGELIQHFDYYSTALHYLKINYNIITTKGKIQRCLSGKRQQHKKFIWDSTFIPQSIFNILYGNSRYRT